jgi:Ecdysteroid kinase-like family
MLFYKLFPLYEKQLKLPKYYYGYEYSMEHSDGIIIMEDMSTTSKTLPMLPGMNDEQVVSMMEELARFHAASWNSRDWMSLIPNVAYDETFMQEMANKTRQLREVRIYYLLNSPHFHSRKSSHSFQLKPEWFGSLIDKLLPYFNKDTYSLTNYSEEKYGSRGEEGRQM